MNKFEPLAGALRDKGFNKQATLLESNIGIWYANALLQPQWEEQVRLAFGGTAYTYLQTLHKYRPHKTQVLETFFPRRPIEVKPLPPLEMEISSHLTLEDLLTAEQISARVCELEIKARKLIYSEVKEMTEENPQLVDMIYDGIEKSFGDIDMSNTEEVLLMYKKQINNRYDRLHRLVELNAPVMIIESEERMLSESLGLDTNNRAELITAAEEALASEDGLQISFARNQEYNGINLQKHRREELEKDIKIGTEVTTEMACSLLHTNYVKDNLDYYIDEKDHKSFSTIAKAPIATLWKSPISVRKSFLETYDVSLEGQHRLLVGLQQIVAGGHASRPNIAQESVLQNDGSFPNLQYSTETLQELTAITHEMADCLDSLPDLTDLAANSRMRKKKLLEFYIEELPKDPLDITFGNDAGCCIFVPNEVEKLQNGSSVPFYLQNTSVKLFAVYNKLSATKKQRIGLVLAFETYGSKNNYLSLNSLELSRNGIAGGKETISQLSRYVEDWFSDFAKQNYYSGVTMGNHDFNTSRNYSIHKDDKVQEELVMSGPSEPFYCEVLTYAKDQPRKLRNSYWLWREP